MRDLKIKPSMDAPKAKRKNPAPKDADSILKKHMDKRQAEKEPESRDPVRYATDRVEKDMRRSAALAADKSRRMVKRCQETRRQDSGNVPEGDNESNALFRSPPSTAARSNAKKPVDFPQSSNAAPQERGRQKAMRDAKAAYRRNLAEKRTAGRHIAPPPFDRGGAMTTPPKSNQGVSGKNGLTPKSGRPFTKTQRSIHTRQVSHTVPPEAIITRRAQAAAQRRARQAALRDAVKNSGKAAKKLGGTAAQAITTMGRGIASAVSSILTAGGGAVVLVLFLTVILVAAIVASPFGILFSNESREAGVVPLAAAVAQVNYDLNEQLEALQAAADYDSISIEGQAADWAEVLAVFAVKVAGSDDVDAADVATMDADRIARLKAVFWDMTTITHRIEVIPHPGSGKDDDGWTERNLYIAITAKTAEGMKT